MKNKEDGLVEVNTELVRLVVT